MGMAASDNRLREVERTLPSAFSIAALTFCDVPILPPRTAR
jgi:hypothetical protein